MFSLQLKPKERNLEKDKEVRRPAVSNPKILEINLIKEESGASFDWAKKITSSLLVFFVAILFITEIYFGLDWWQTQENNKLAIITKEVSNVNREISVINNEADEAIKYKNKLIILSSLLNNHVYWSNFLNWLEKNTLSSVQYDNLTGDLTGIYSFNATAKTFADVSWQVKSFSDDPITKKVSVVQASVLKSKENEKGGQISFVLDLEVDPIIFKK